MKIVLMHEVIRDSTGTMVAMAANNGNNSCGRILHKYHVNITQIPFLRTTGKYAKTIRYRQFNRHASKG